MNAQYFQFGELSVMSAQLERLALFDRALAVNQDPFRMFFERRVTEYLEQPSTVGVVLGVVDATTRVAKDAIHELVLLDELGLGRRLGVRLAHADHEQHRTHR